MHLVSPQSRIQVLDVPSARPGHCFMCGSANTEDRKYIDFGMQMDWYGAIYFCTYCFGEVALAIGWMTNESHMDLVKLYEELVQKKEQLQKIVNSQGRALLEFAANCHCGIFGSDDDNVDDSSDRGDSENVSASQSPTEPDSDFDESSGSEGSSSIHSARKRKPANSSASVE